MRTLLVCGLLGGCFLVSPALLHAQASRQERSIVGNTEDDIRRASSFTRLSEKERERNDHAMRHLAEFDSKFSRGHWDQDKLDHAIDDLKNVVQNNPLSPQDRDVLRDDLVRLRDFRSRHGH